MAFESRNELIDAALSIVREVAGSPTFDSSREAASGLVDSAVDWFSRFSPRELRVEYDGDGAAYRFALPDDWRQDFSAVLRVEYPIQQKRVFLTPNRWSLYPTANGATHLALLDAIPASSESIGVDYIAPHHVEDEDPANPDDPDYVLSTVTAHQGVVQLLLAVLIARLQASRTGYTVDPAVEGDAVNYRGKGAEWAAIATNLLATASSSFGQDLSQPSRGGSRFSRSWGI